MSLQSLIKDELVTVIRGKFGVTQSINVWDLVVGDVILLDTGERIPADCIVISQSELEIKLPSHLMEDREQVVDDVFEMKKGFKKTYD